MWASSHAYIVNKYFHLYLLMELHFHCHQYQYSRSPMNIKQVIRCEGISKSSWKIKLKVYFDAKHFEIILWILSVFYVLFENMALIFTELKICGTKVNLTFCTFFFFKLLLFLLLILMLQLHRHRYFPRPSHISHSFPPFYYNCIVIQQQS